MYLTDEEFNAVKAVKLPNESLNNVRDLFVVQCLTGLSFTDLMSFDFNKVSKVGGSYVIEDKRNKTGRVLRSAAARSPCDSEEVPRAASKILQPTV